MSQRVLFPLDLCVVSSARIALKKRSLLCGQTRAPLRGAIASQRARLSGIGTIRRAAVFALCAATSMKPGVAFYVSPIETQDFRRAQSRKRSQRETGRNFW